MSLRLLGWVPLLILGLAVGSFAERTQSTFDPSIRPLPGVVFTGQFSRVRAGLDLLSRHSISSLLISGANSGAGIPAAGFADQFNLSPALRAAVASGNLALASSANTTLENAEETSRWAAILPPKQPVVLITSTFHMPRASVALERALVDRQVMRYTVSADKVAWRDVVAEFLKYSASYVTTAHLHPTVEKNQALSLKAAQQQENERVLPPD